MGFFLKLLGLVLGASGGAIWLPEGPTDYASSRAIAIPIPPPTKPLPRAAFGGGAAEDVPHEEFFDALRLHAGPLQRRFAELDCRDVGESAAKSAERPHDAAGKVDFLEHCFIDNSVLIDARNLFRDRAETIHEFLP